jgi:hypothetical protein
MSGSGDRSLSNIFDDIIRNIQGIIRSEVRLAKAEMQEESIKAGKAAGIAVSGALLALYALRFLLTRMRLRIGDRPCAVARGLDRNGYRGRDCSRVAQCRTEPDEAG